MNSFKCHFIWFKLGLKKNENLSVQWTTLVNRGCCHGTKVSESCHWQFLSTCWRISIRMYNTNDPLSTLIPWWRLNHITDVRRLGKVHKNGFKTLHNEQLLLGEWRGITELINHLNFATFNIFVIIEECTFMTSLHWIFFLSERIETNISNFTSINVLDFMTKTSTSFYTLWNFTRFF